MERMIFVTFFSLVLFSRDAGAMEEYLHLSDGCLQYLTGNDLAADIGRRLH
jgi:hypothetical protein